MLSSTICHWTRRCWRRRRKSPRSVATLLEFLLLQKPRLYPTPKCDSLAYLSSLRSFGTGNWIVNIIKKRSEQVKCFVRLREKNKTNIKKRLGHSSSLTYDMYMVTLAVWWEGETTVCGMATRDEEGIDYVQVCWIDSLSSAIKLHK